MADLKTKRNESSITEFLNKVEPIQKREDSFTILNMMKDETGEEPKMWGSSIIGFGDFHYKYESGREGDWFIAGFSPRKQNFSLHLMTGFDRYEKLLSKLGKYKTGKSCLYINKLEDVDEEVLRKLIRTSYQHFSEN